MFFAVSYRVWRVYTVVPQTGSSVSNVDNSSNSEFENSESDDTDIAADVADTDSTGDTVAEDRYGTTNRLTIIYMIVGLVLILVGVIQYVIDCRRYRCA